MRILILHNFYQRAGGEDEVYAAEGRLLEEHGHEVYRYEVRNDGLEHANRLRLARDTIWSPSSYRAINALVRKTKPDVAHFHNTLPRISPAAYYAVTREGVPVVKTLHNYRLVCPNALLSREGRPCHDCVGRAIAWSGIRHACYRGSRSATATVAAMSATHRLLGTWDRQVAVYIALTEFARDRMVEGGLPADRIVVKPNFVYPDPGEGSGNGGYALFVGRLSPEKGIDTLLEAWRTLSPEIPLHIVGDGPLAPEVATAALEMDNVSWLGWRNASDVATLVADAKFLVCPSNWYEGCSRVVLEAFAAGTPVIASNIGSLAEMVSDGISGRLMLPGDSQSLIRAARALSSGQVDLPAMRAAARRVFDERFTSAANYEMLMSIYRTAMQRGAPGATARASSESR